MTRSDEITLIMQQKPKPPERQTDEKGHVIILESQRIVYGDVKSVGSAEAWNARQSERELTMKVTIYKVDYEGERIVMVDGVRYRVERDYSPAPDDIELTLSTQNEAKRGRNGA